MLDVERRQQIVAFIEQNNGATVAELSGQFRISEATARRDLVILSKRGLIERAHGGAIPRRLRQSQGLPEPPVLERASLLAEEKRRIGQAAAELVEDGDAIIIGGGTTTAEMIPHLAKRQGLTVITNALHIATLLAAYPNVAVIVLGGMLRHTEFALLGAFAEEALENLRADKLFIGFAAIHVDYGFSSDDLLDVQASRSLMAAAREVIVLADHTKFGKIATIRVAPIKSVHRLVTDAATPRDDITTLRDHSVTVTIA